MKEVFEFIFLTLVVALLFGRLTKRNLPPDEGFEIDFEFPVMEKINIRNGILFFVFLVMFYLIKH